MTVWIECAQGTDEWKAARCGVITASKFKDACDKLKSGKPSAKANTYAAQVAMERVTGKPSDEQFVTWQMKQGTEREPMARLEYESLTGNLASESGIVLTDDRLFGYSSDGYVGDDGIIEIKSLASAEKIIEIWRNHNPEDYMHQIQGGLWITGRKWADFIMYVPELESVGKQLYYQRIERDESFIGQLEVDLMQFASTVSELEAVLRQQAA
ncbi:MAG TPA: YqaJ viral recombinase family protein [Terriglobales bacterium]|nr:YqaJ viral recombinase family protein [Terriglobales bacterium]